MRSGIVTTSSGRDIEVMSGNVTLYMGRSTGTVVIPANLCDEMTNEQIGEIVRECAIDAKTIFAEELAYYYIGHGYLSRGNVRPHDYKIFLNDVGEEFANMIEQLAGRSDIIDEFIEQLSKARKIVAKQDAIDKTKAKRRSQTSGNKYNSKFVAVGSRDGFYCARCGSNDNLQLDHVFPISRGGDGNLDNLQILCRKCNIKKSDKVEE